MTTFKLSNAELGFSVSDPGVAVGDAVLSAYTDFSAQVAQGVLVAAANFDTERVEATFTEPASESTSPVAATWTLRVRVKQDPATANGLAQFLYDNDSGVTGNPVYFMLGLAEGGDPKAIGECYVSPQDFGGTARSVLYADLQFSVPTRPDIQFGNTADA